MNLGFPSPMSRASFLDLMLPWHPKSKLFVQIGALSAKFSLSPW